MELTKRKKIWITILSLAVLGGFILLTYELKFEDLKLFNLLLKIFNVVLAIFATVFLLNLWKIRHKKSVSTSITVIITFISVLFIIIEVRSDRLEPIYSAEALLKIEIEPTKITHRKSSDNTYGRMMLFKNNRMIPFMQAPVKYSTYGNDGLARIILIKYELDPSMSKELTVDSLNEAEDVLFQIIMLEENVKILNAECNFTLNSSERKSIKIPEQKIDEFVFIHSNPEKKPIAVEIE